MSANAAAPVISPPLPISKKKQKQKKTSSSSTFVRNSNLTTRTPLQRIPRTTWRRIRLLGGGILADQQPDRRYRLHFVGKDDSTLTMKSKGIDDEIANFMSRRIQEVIQIALAHCLYAHRTTVNRHDVSTALDKCKIYYLSLHSIPTKKKKKKNNNAPLSFVAYNRAAAPGVTTTTTTRWLSIVVV